ncbi:hypothetical protein [Rickettsiales endosymbiont of Stachyamoeba lipophora]|uniref:hypothetical protein n=1 Tax=Rickettsiales endosymbiont of Stachyamoeba lipophora TaxID=2486578 RepID=UPI000F649601|nr:hypothetical protein [Rickettsiales endosymbiont of Stachyamoeba lipophora]AZL15242.1 hypothetical protein EF513_01540 [Rickettsiales endosymbiont of Stachyamoeba lipophora]
MMANKNTTYLPLEDANSSSAALAEKMVKSLNMTLSTLLSEEDIDEILYSDDQSLLTQVGSSAGSSVSPSFGRQSSKVELIAQRLHASLTDEEFADMVVSAKLASEIKQAKASSAVQQPSVDVHSPITT